MSKKQIVVGLSFVLLAAVAFFVFWFSADNLIISLLGKPAVWWTVFVNFGLAWALFLGFWGLFAVLVREKRLLFGGLMIWGGLFFGLLYYRYQIFHNQEWAVYIGLFMAAGLVLVLGFAGRRLERDVKNHLKFSCAHLLLPWFKRLGIFLSLLVSLQVFWLSPIWLSHFKFEIPDFLMRMIGEQVAEITKSSLESWVGDVQGITSDDAWLDKFLQGEEPLPEELRSLVEEGKIPKEYEAQLQSLGMPVEIVESFLSTVEIDEQGMIKEPVSGDPGEIVGAGLGVMIQDQIDQLLEPLRPWLGPILAAFTFMALFYLNTITSLGALFAFWLFFKLLILVKIVKMEKVEVEAERLVVN
ncbi:hypothetical protein B5M47_00450 [candidate division CPR3 bacterium 4484_211]|uniref:Uncharacterized protein n=1 Tax=candidate division CPR3 bacterium 4484_211 TaxID=1968527 RepID=A0A1W9NZA6_UNCC3|nr:MAG: hypothetical protein B5M47_00450 [candidate division CPR3 bacterium 4484_211]